MTVKNKSSVSVPKPPKSSTPIAEPLDVRFPPAQVEVSYSSSKIEIEIPIRDSWTMARCLRQCWSNRIEFVEEAYLLFLNRAFQPLGYYKLAVGSKGNCIVDTFAVVQMAVLTHSDHIVLAHNHPSGKLRPSDTDISTTKRVKKALDLVNIKLLDHLIMTKDAYYSFVDEQEGFILW